MSGSCETRLLLTKSDLADASAKFGVAAPRAHRVCAGATVSSQTPVHDPKMYPPEQPIEPQKTSDASTQPVFLGFFF